MITFDPSLWFMFPVAIFVATVAMMSGIGGATLFTPLFLIVLKLQPAVALASGLFIEFFGFTTGVIGYARKQCIDYGLVKKILPYSITGTVIGLGLSFIIPKSLIELILAGILLYLSFEFLRRKKKCEPVMWPEKKVVSPKQDTNNSPQVGPKYKMSWLLGGSLFGVSSSGLGEMNEFILLKRMHLLPGRASGTSVMVIAVSALIAALFYMSSLYASSQTDLLSTVTSIVIFAVPGVIIGANIGVQLATRISTKYMEMFVGTLFFIVAIVIIINSTWTLFM